MTQATAHKCPNCGQDKTKNGQPFKNLSALNTHINVHCPKKEKQNNPNVKTECTHVYQLLNSNSANEIVKTIIEAGFTKCCKKCGDLQ